MWILMGFSSASSSAQFSLHSQATTAPHVEVVIEPGGGQVVFGVDAVQVKMCERPRAAVVVDNGKCWAGYRVGAAQALGQALAEGGLARAQAPVNAISAPDGSVLAKSRPAATVSSVNGS